MEDDDFLRINGTSVEGRSASEVLSDIGAQASHANPLTFSALDLSSNGSFIVGGSTPAMEAGADLAGSGLSATTGDGTLVLSVDTGIGNGKILVCDSNVEDDS